MIMEFAQFILEHDGDDLSRLALARDRFSGQVEDFDLALNTLEGRRKLRAKVPEWVALPQLRYPYKLSAEQCSSSETARYKASVALAACGFTSVPSKKAENAGTDVLPNADAVKNGQKCGRACRVADLTGGLGVDSWAFAQVFGEVLYNEMRPELADAARYNFKELGLNNITVRNCTLGSPVQPAMTASVMADTDRPSPVMTVGEILDGFEPDVLFLDPARRASDGRKVFRLEDCQPDVLQLLPELFEACPRLLLKLSPMADITLVCKQLKNVKDVHVVAAEGECKELLLLLERDWNAPYSLTIYESGAVMEIIDGGCGDVPRSSLRDPSHFAVPSGHKLWAPPVPGANSGPPYYPPRGIFALTGLAEGGHGFGNITTPSYLFEPGKALLKAGAFELPCRYGLEKMDRHTHLYVGEVVPEALRPFGKVFEILEVAPLNNRSIKDISKRYPSAEVTARNIPLSSSQLRAKLGVRSGASVHIFGIKTSTGNILLATRRLQD